MRIALCRHCGKTFKFRASKRYCSDECRLQNWRDRAEPCCYCGCPADTLDHVPPRCVRPFLVAQNMLDWPFIEVPACKECNCLLGAATLWTVKERKEVIKEKLFEKYKHYLCVKDRTEAELVGVDIALQQYYRQGIAMRELTKQRLAW